MFKYLGQISPTHFAALLFVICWCFLPQDRVLNGARSLIYEVSECEEVDLKADGGAVKNEANFMAEEWHHKYEVSFKVAAERDPKQFLADYFEKNVKQMGDAACKISYVETDKLVKE